MASELERATWVVERGIPAVEKDIPDLKVRVANLEQVVDRFFRDERFQDYLDETGEMAVRQKISQAIDDKRWERIKKALPPKSAASDAKYEEVSEHLEKLEKPKKGKK
jgi:hypothetical protein